MEKQDTKLTDLAKKLPVKGIQRTKGTETRKGYDTTGYGYQYAVNRFNEVMGYDWGYNIDVVNEVTGTYNTGTPFFDITVACSIWVKDKDSPRMMFGGHRAVLHADALKGASTNAFKKAAAMWGVGKDVYEGTVDDDNQPIPEGEVKESKVNTHRQTPPILNDERNRITDKQRKRIYAIAKERKLTDKEFEEFVIKWGYKASKDIEWHDYKDMCKELETMLGMGV